MDLDSYSEQILDCQFKYGNFKNGLLQGNYMIKKLQKSFLLF